MKCRLQVMHAKTLSDDNVDSLMQTNYAKIASYPDLLLFVQISKGFIIVILGEKSVLVLQIGSLVKHVEEELTLHECYFNMDPLFSMKFAHAIDITLQTLLVKHT